jgi:putative addiction module killer protein
MVIEVRVYEAENGNCPFDDWFNDLDATLAAKVTVAVNRIEGGHQSGLKPVGGGVSEWRIHSGPGLRIYLAFDGETLVILLGGGTKRRQDNDIEQAISAWQDYKSRKQSDRGG